MFAPSRQAPRVSSSGIVERRNGSNHREEDEKCAIDGLMAYREQIEKKVVSFAELATKVSDCSSARHGGDLGTFGRGAMQKAFEDAAFGLEVGEMSGMVDSDRVFIIL